jgi:hypothetical protein
MKVKRVVAEFEDLLVYAQGGIDLYRKGISKAFLSHGFPMIREGLQAARRELEALGMYERCRDALVQAEALVKQGPEHDYEAETLILEANRALMQVSGSHEAMSRRYRAANDAPKSQGGEGPL